MDDLVINCQFASSIIDDQNPNTASTIGKSIVEPGPQPALINNWETLLDITSFGHGHDTSIITDVKNTVLLEDRTEHTLNDDRGRWVGYEAGFFMKLLGEEIDSEVAMLSSLSGRGDPNHLAWSTLNDQQIANPDMMAGNGDGVWPSTTLDETNTLTHTITHTSRAAVFSVDDNLFTIVTMMMKGVKDTIGGSLDSVTDGVVMTFVVVVAHFGSMTAWYIDGGLAFGFDSYFSRLRGTPFVFDVVSWLGSSTVITLGDVDFRFVDLVLMTRRNFDVDLGFRVALVRFLIASCRKMSVLHGKRGKKLRERLLGQQN